MGSARDDILQALRSAPKPFAGLSHEPGDLLPVVHPGQPAQLVDQFKQAAEALNCVIHEPKGMEKAVHAIVQLVSSESSVTAWSDQEVGLPGLQDALLDAGVSVADPADPDATTGITGATAALASTGTLVLASGPGRDRGPSLLPVRHIAVLHRDKILSNLESWTSGQSADAQSAFRSSSNLILISGPSRTADIGMELVLGMHGPRELHVVMIGA